MIDIETSTAVLKELGYFDDSCDDNEISTLKICFQESEQNQIENLDIKEKEGVRSSLIKIFISHWWS